MYTSHTNHFHKIRSKFCFIQEIKIIHNLVSMIYKCFQARRKNWRTNLSGTRLT